MWKALWKARPHHDLHTYRECLGMEPAAGSIVVAAGGKDSDRKEDCQIHEYHQEIAFGYD